MFVCRLLVFCLVSEKFPILGRRETSGRRGETNCFASKTGGIQGESCTPLQGNSYQKEQQDNNPTVSQVCSGRKVKK